MENDFLIKNDTIAIVGASNNDKKFGNKIYLELKKRGYKIYPINPKEKLIEGDTCYKSLKDLPEKPDIVNFVVPSHITERVLKDCLELDIKKVWMQPGSSTKKAIEFCEKKGIKAIHDTCIML